MAVKGTSGTAVLAVAVGGIILYSGLKGKGISSAFQNLLAGKSPATATSANPISQLSVTSGPGAIGLTGTSAEAVAVGSCTAAQTQANQELGQQLAAAAGWTGQDWTDYNQLVMDESGWCNTIQNPSSTAYGIGQFLDSTWAAVGGSKTSDARIQILLQIAYIKGRYQNPSNALAHENEFHWY